MNRKKITFVLLFAALFLAGNAQNFVQSGSFEFFNINGKYKGVIILQSSTQRFEFPITEHIFIANLLPDKYSLVVEYHNNADRQNITIEKIVEIESQQTIVCQLNKGAKLVFSTMIDKTSMPILPPHLAVEPISEDDFINICNSLKKESSENTKVHTIKAFADLSFSFTTAQVKRLLQYLISDDNKLQCAKYLSGKVIDRQNLPLVKDVFISISNRDEFLKYISKQ